MIIDNMTRWILSQKKDLVCSYLRFRRFFSGALKFQVNFVPIIRGAPGTNVGTPNKLPVFPPLVAYCSLSMFVAQTDRITFGSSNAKPALILNKP